MSNLSDKSEPLMDIREAAKYLKLSRSAMYKPTEEGKLPAGVHT